MRSSRVGRVPELDRIDRVVGGVPSSFIGGIRSFGKRSSSSLSDSNSGLSVRNFKWIEKRMGIGLGKIHPEAHS